MDLLNLLPSLIIHRMEVLLGLLGIGDHGLVAGLPSRRAHLSELVGVLEGLHQPKSLVHAATDGQIVDGHLAQVLLLVDEEEAAEGDARFLVQHAIRTAHLHRLVCEQRDVHVAQSTLLTRLVDPGQVGEVAVRGHANDLTVDCTELRSTVAERDDLGGTDKGAGGGEGVEWRQRFSYLATMYMTSHRNN